MSDVLVNGPLWLTLLLTKVQEHSHADTIVFMKNGEQIGSLTGIIEMCPVEWLVDIVADLYSKENP